MSKIAPSSAHPSTSSAIASGLNVDFKNIDIWKILHDIPHEMMITKAGRRMLPEISLHISEMKESAMYRIMVCFLPKDKYCYTYRNGNWEKIYRKDFDTTHHLIFTDSIFTGNCVFKNVTIDNIYISSGHGIKNDNSIILQSRRKYQVMVKIEQEFVDPSEEPHTKIIMLPYTEFITVTNIHNRKVQEIKSGLTIRRMSIKKEQENNQVDQSDMLENIVIVSEQENKEVEQSDMTEENVEVQDTVKVEETVEIQDTVEIEETEDTEVSVKEARCQYCSNFGEFLNSDFLTVDDIEWKDI